MERREFQTVNPVGSPVAWPNDPNTCKHERTSGPPIADTFQPERAKHPRGHLVMECADCGTWLCADATQADCERCGRTFEEHLLLNMRIEIPPGEPGFHPDPADYGDCPQYLAPTACSCKLPRVPKALTVARPARTGKVKRRVNRKNGGRL